MGFADVIGHARVLRILREACRRERVHHAYLFAGPSGVGKELVAFQLFKRLNCLSPVDGDACDRCGPCRKLTADSETSRGDEAELAFTFADLMVLRPEGAFIKIARVRELARRIAYSPVEGHAKTILVRDAHKLHETAANALLKTLEEPATATVFVLVTEAPHLLLPTIVSRCQLVRFGALAREDVARYLRERADVDPEAAGPLAAMAAGSIGRALDLVRNPIVQRRGEWLREVGALPGQSDHAAFAMAETLASERGQLPVYLDILRTWFRDQLLAREGVPIDAMTNIDLADELRAAAALVDRDALLQRLSRIDTAERALHGNANAQLTLDWLLLHLFRV